MTVPGIVHPTVYLNGALVPASEARVSAFDRGFLMADGIFETFYITRGTPIECARHLARLARSADYMRLSPLPDAVALREAIGALLEANGLAGRDGAEASVRLTISRGVAVDGPPTAFAFARRLTEGQLRKRSEGVLGFALPFTRSGAGRDLTHHKTLAYLASSLGQILLHERTPDPRAEGFFHAAGGALLEGTSSNLFVVEGQGLVTPPISQGILPGTSRAVVMELADELHVPVAEEEISVARARAADEVFVTSSTLRVAPVISLDGIPVGGRGALVDRLQSAFDARIDAAVERYHAEREAARG